MPELVFENSAWWLLLIVLLSAVGIWLMYFKGKGFTRNQRLTLACLRFLTFCCIGLLLLSPLLKSIDRKEEKPLLIWLEDHSRSMLLSGDSSQVKDLLKRNEDIQSQLEKRYQVERFDFGRDLSAPSDSFRAPATNMYNTLNDVKERFYNQNVGGVVMLSDGISNEGNNPAYAITNLGYPVFTVGFGDTTSTSDMLIERVVSNKVSYLNNNFPVEIYLKARELNGKSYRLRVKDSRGRQLFEKSGSISDGEYFERVSLFLKSEEVGLQRFSVYVDPVSDEQNLNNNALNFTVNILNDQKVIWIVGSGPHPDMAALGNALESGNKYKVETYIEADLPSANKADLYILHDPTEAMLQRFSSLQTPLWIIQGGTTPSASLQRYLNIISGDNNFEEVAASINSGFNLFTITDNEIEFASDLPPLWSPFGRAESEHTMYSLFTKKIGTVVTSDPLWFYTQNKDVRYAFILGTGLWRWRLEDFRQQKSHARFDGLITKSAQYLTTGKQDRRFVVDLAERFDQSEAIRGEARLYNSSIELTNEPPLKISFKNEQKQTFDFSFSKTQNTYQLNAGRLPVGVYTWSSSVKLGDEEFNQKGSLVVEKSMLEQADLVARHQLLRSISRESGGHFYKSNQMNLLKEDLLQNPEAKSLQILETKTASLIDKRWLFAIFLLLLAAEWGLRKFFGNY